MPLEDLEAIGYDVFRPPTADGAPPTGASVRGYGRQWNLMPGEDEEAVVAEARNHQKMATKLTQAQASFKDNYQNWPTMTNAQKDNANRQAQRAIANLIQHVRGDLSDEGV